MTEGAAATAATSPAVTAPAARGVRIQLLGQFAVSVDGRAAGPWPRPSARRLCELLLVSPGRRIRRDLACEELFGERDQRAAARALSKALSMARATLAGVGEPGSSLLAANLTHIWVAGPVEVDAEILEEELRAALAFASGSQRAARLHAALAAGAGDAELLADEPDAEWARSPRQRLEALRQEARLVLARDLAAGSGRAGPDEVAAAWQSCLDHDPACEEAAGALARAYVAQRRPELAARVLQRCRAALEELGLRLSPSLENAYAAAASSVSASTSERRPAENPAPAPPVPREERRPVSVLFAEIAAAPGLAGGHDPETLREMVGGVLAAVMTEVELLGGTVTSVSGRGLQALFGVPEAHEDDPERAVRAAYRAMATASPRTAADGQATPGEGAAASGALAPDGGAALLRIGVESGPAVVGPVAAGARTEYAAFGDVVSVAAALQSAARPGSVLVGPATRAVTGHLFAWGAGEKVALDPAGEPVVASYLEAPRARQGSRLPPLGGTAPLTGRDAEMRALAAALRELAGGRGSVAAVIGDPGLGKTRLTLESRNRFIAWAGAGGGRTPLWLEGRCTSYASSTPYGLYRQLLASWIGVSPDQPAAEIRQALAAALTSLLGNANLLPPLARLMGLPDPAAPRVSPAEAQRVTFDAVRSLVTRFTAVAPTVLVLEDLHWADPTSVRLTRHLAELATNRRLLLLVTSRPEAAADVTAIAPRVRDVRLLPLPDDAARRLAGSLIGGASRDVLDTAVASADGNPLFVEERLAALIEAGILVRDQGTWWLSDTEGPQPSQVLERLVRSRIDRLSPAAQDAVRAASVLGFEFQATQLSAMLGGQPPGVLEPVLDELHASDLIHHRQPRGPEPAFVFRHALIAEAAYLGLLRAERRALHARAAAAIEAAAGDCLTDVAAVLGRHYASAGDAGRAVRYLELAGDHATDAFANEEAISSFRAALRIAGEPGAGPGRAGPGREHGTAMAVDAVRLHDKLANVLWRTGRHDEARTAFRDALSIGGAPAVPPLTRAHLWIRLGRLELIQSRLEAASQAFDAAAELLGGEAGPVSQDDTTVDQWLELMIDGRADMHWLRGETDRAEAVLDAVSPLLEARGTPARKSVYFRLVVMQRLARSGMRPDSTDVALLRLSLEFAGQTGEEKDAAYAAHFLGWILGLHGDLAEARQAQEMAVAMAERIGEIFLLPAALTTLALIALRGRDPETARASLSRALAIDRQGENGELTTQAMVCHAMLSWLDLNAGEAPGLAAELAGLVDAADGTTRLHLESVVSLARGLKAE